MLRPYRPRGGPAYDDLVTANQYKNSADGPVQVSMVTRPLRRSYVAPTTFTFPCLTDWAMIGSNVRNRSTPARTLALMALSSLSPSLPRDLATTGVIRLTRPLIAPGRVSWASRCLTAALTAPQLLWPSTMTKGAPSSATPYSMLPFTAVPSTTLPATRTTNKSPTPWSKRSSGATRESAQPTMTAIGNCPSASAEKSSGLRRGLAGRPSTNRPLPSNNVCSASSAVGRVGGWAAGSGAGRAVPRLPSTSPAAVIPLIHRNSRREEDMARSFRVGRASALGRCAHHRPRVAPAPASVLHRTQKLLHLAVKHRRLFQVDGVAGPGLDEQPGRRNRAF